MFNLMNLFGKKDTNVSETFLRKDEIAEFLKTSPEKLAEFEAYYKTQVLPNVAPSDDDVFHINAKEAAAMTASDPMEMSDALHKLITNVVMELTSQTITYVYDGEHAETHQPLALPDNFKPTTLDDVKAFPAEMQTQVTGNLMKSDIPGESAPALLFYLKKMQETKDPNIKKTMYHQFRQGLDILDLDPITYAMIDTNKNSMGHWLPQLVEANHAHGFFKIPKTVIAKVPLTLLQLTRQPYEALTPTTKTILNQWAMEVFDLDVNGDYFIKTGTYSSKFDFRNCHVHDPQEVLELGEYLMYIHFAALQMASPLSKPCIYGASTTTEWVVREFIEDVEDNPVIYKGLPLHTEYRVFIDCDTNEVLGCNPYWDPETMKKRFAENRDGHDVHDYISYKAHEDKLMSKFYMNKDDIIMHVKELLPDLHLNGQWSLDIMQNGDDFWLIDMALAETSAGYDKAVAIKDRRPTHENWIPVIEVN